MLQATINQPQARFIADKDQRSKHYNCVIRSKGRCSGSRAPCLKLRALKFYERRDPHGRQGQIAVATAVSTLSAQVVKAQGRQFTAAGWLATLSIAAVVMLVLYRFVDPRRRQAQDAEAQEEALEADGYESEAYKIVLASVRQNIIFQRALQSMREGNSVRAMVELHRVLEHNAICRKPINLDYYAESDLEDIYRLHLQNSELPLQYSTLLHLRQILNLSDGKAESLERSLKDSAYSFYI